jgi:hypothetical protein
MVKKFSDILVYENKVPVEFITCNKYDIINEANETTETDGETEYTPNQEQPGIPKFSIKGIEGIEDIPINKPMKPNIKLLTKAIKYGMIFLITYKGLKDEHNTGHERVVYPMVLGKSMKGVILLRGWHLKGWSVSNNAEVQKQWRMFRFDLIKSMIFTGSFYRLPPAGYNMHDKGMRGGIIARADFNEIRRNQQELLKSKEIQNRKDIEFGGKEGEENKPEFSTIRVKSSGTQLDLMNPYDNPYIKDQQNAANLRITLLKTIYGDKYIAVLDALGKPGNTVKVLDGKGRSLGIYTVLDAISGEKLKKIKKVKGNTVFDLHFFDKKV